jgi:hypothetical protein
VPLPPEPREPVAAEMWAPFVFLEDELEDLAFEPGGVEI